MGTTSLLNARSRMPADRCLGRFEHGTAVNGISSHSVLLKTHKLLGKVYDAEGKYGWAIESVYFDRV